jgi:DNA-binding CsgD family transcriptional regulator
MSRIYRQAYRLFPFLRRAVSQLVVPIADMSKGLILAENLTYADPSQRQGLPQEILRVLFALTPAECRVALLLGDGHAANEVANIVGVTKNTVHSQIKSIFSKTGVKRQSELIRLLLCYSGATTQRTTASAG